MNNTNNGHPINQEREDKLRKFNARSYKFFKWSLGIAFLIVAITGLASGAVTTFLCWLLASALVLPPVTRFLRERYKFHIHTGIKIVGIVVLSFMAFINTPPEKGFENMGKVADKSNLSPTDAVKVSISGVLGDKTNMGKPVVVKVELTKYTSAELKDYGYKPDTDVAGAFIEINSSENLTSNLQKGTMNDEAVKIFKNVFAEFPNIGDIILWSDLPVKDNYGNSSNGAAIIYSIARPLYQKINWDNFNHNDLPQLLKSEGQTDDRNSYFEKIGF